MCRPILLWNTLFSPVVSLFASSRNVQRTYFVIASTMSNIISIITYIHFSPPEVETNFFLYRTFVVGIQLLHWTLFQSSCDTGLLACTKQNPERTNSLNQSQGSQRLCHLRTLFLKVQRDHVIFLVQVLHWGRNSQPCWLQELQIQKTNNR